MMIYYSEFGEFIKVTIKKKMKEITNDDEDDIDIHEDVLPSGLSAELKAYAEKLDFILRNNVVDIKLIKICSDIYMKIASGIITRGLSFKQKRLIDQCYISTNVLVKFRKS